MSVEDEVKTLIMTSVWNVLVNNGVDINKQVNSQEIMDEVADEVYTLIWEYIVDTD